MKAARRAMIETRHTSVAIGAARLALMVLTAGLSLPARALPAPKPAPPHSAPPRPLPPKPAPAKPAPNPVPPGPSASPVAPGPPAAKPSPGASAVPVPTASPQALPPFDAGAIPFSEILRFEDSKIRSPEQWLIHTPQELQAFWWRHAPGQEMPPIDFSRDWVIAVVLGEQPTAGYGACVDQVRLEQSLLKVRLRRQFPPGDSFLPVQPASPGCLVRLPAQPTEKADFSYFSQQQRTVLPMRTLSQISNSLILTPRYVVVQDLDSFREVWQAHTGQLANLPAVDFGKEMVIAAFMGEQPTGGFGLAIQEIAEVDGRLRVKVVKTAPTPEQSVIQMLTAPAHLVTVPRRDAPIDFDTVSP